MKRYLKGFMCLMLMVGLVALAGCQKKDAGTPDSGAADNVNDETKPAGENNDFDYEKMAKEFLESIFAGDIESAKAYKFSDELQPYIDDGFLEQLAEVESQLGTYEGITNIEPTESGGNYISLLTCMFADYELKMIVTFDSDGVMVGLIQNDLQPRTQEEASLPPDGILESELELVIDDEHALGGTLALPEGEGPFPVVVLVHGSGPNDRNEEIYANAPFKDIAWGLAQQGIAVYRYDKRTNVYSEEMADNMYTLYDETIQDAGLAVTMMREHDMIDENRVYVLGHSLGAMSVPWIYDENPADGYIMMAGPARSLDKVLLDQFYFFMEIQGDIEGAEEILTENIKAVQKLENLEELDDEEILGGYTVFYWKSLLGYNQIEMAKAIDKPVLVLQGEEDYQVTMQEFELWKENFAEKENWTFISYPGLTHMFMQGSYENGPDDYMAKQNVSEDVIGDIVSFIQSMN